jgi:hypothetical protein
MPGWDVGFGKVTFARRWCGQREVGGRETGGGFFSSKVKDNGPGLGWVVGVEKTMT